ncbi:MAG: phospholipid carrier-dependent glycosyltransferase [Verrucomicrobiota bacterium]
MKTPPGWLVAISLIVVAITPRVLLGLSAPAPMGYVYDFYHEPIQLLYENKKLPEPADCWQCYQPPLFTLVGYVIYAAAMQATDGNVDQSLQALAWFTTLVSLAFLALVFLIVQRFVPDLRHLAVVSALLVTLPVVFIASYSIESELFCATIMLGAFYLYLRYTDAEAKRTNDADADAQPHWKSWAMVVAIGILAGLAALTKYSGLLMIIALGFLFAGRFLAVRTRRRFAHLAIYGGVSAFAGGGDILTNWLKRDQLFTGNRAWQNVETKGHENLWDWYEFDTFQLSRLLDLMEPDAEPGELKRFRAYNRSVLTSHYGQIYTDCSIFSNPTRHGLHKGLYPEKPIPIALIATILYAGLIPVLLGILGFFRALTRPREHLPLFVLTIVFLTFYTAWFLSYPEWMLKTKYLLTLLPFALILCVGGLRLAKRVHPRVEQGFLGMLWGLVGVCVGYNVVFAVVG